MLVELFLTSWLLKNTFNYWHHTRWLTNDYYIRSCLIESCLHAFTYRNIIHYYLQHNFTISSLIRFLKSEPRSNYWYRNKCFLLKHLRSKDVCFRNQPVASPSDANYYANKNRHSIDIEPTSRVLIGCDCITDISPWYLRHENTYLSREVKLPLHVFLNTWKLLLKDLLCLWILK